MAKKLLCDTGIISRYLQGFPKYVNIVEKIGVENVTITPIIRAELHRWLSVYKGLTTQQRNIFRKRIRFFPLLHINENISKLAVEITDKDDSLDPSDIFIGATAKYYKIELLTINKKHFQRIKNLKLR